MEEKYSVHHLKKTCCIFVNGNLIMLIVLCCDDKLMIKDMFGPAVMRIIMLEPEPGVLCFREFRRSTGRLESPFTLSSSTPGTPVNRQEAIFKYRLHKLGDHKIPNLSSEVRCESHCEFQFWPMTSVHMGYLRKMT